MRARPRRAVFDQQKLSVIFHRPIPKIPTWEHELSGKTTSLSVATLVLAALLCSPLYGLLWVKSCLLAGERVARISDSVMATDVAPTGPAVTLTHRHVFGLQADVKNNVHYAEEREQCAIVPATPMCLQPCRRLMHFDRSACAATRHLVKLQFPEDQPHCCIFLTVQQFREADLRSMSRPFRSQETQIIYPSGTNTILWMADQKQQKFFHGPEGAEGITCLAVNSTKRFLAVAEKCSEGATFVCYRLHR